MNNIRPCGNNEKWCESCVSKGKCNYTKNQDIIEELDMGIKALDEFTYNGKTIREWIEIIVAQDLLAITELEKIKAEIIACTQQEEGEVPACINYGIKLSTEIVEKHIAELKGENNE